MNDLNDNNPGILATYDKTVSEGAALRTIVHQIVATDADTGVNANVQYVINSGNTATAFSINADSGRIQVGAMQSALFLYCFDHKPKVG